MDDQERDVGGSRAGGPGLIYEVGRTDAPPAAVTRSSFGKMGVPEGLLQQWIVDDPRMLAEDLLIVTREYDGFDKSRKRLDILALDKAGKLVVIELKLDTAGAFADLQALNYAAMVSTMETARVVELYAEQHDLSHQEAEAAIGEFLGVDTLPDMDDQPRVILAAGGFNGAETTATAMWLRSFGLDIKLVEVAPYAFENERMILVPRVVIPTPEAEEYMVGHERKDAAQRASRTASVDRWVPFLNVVQEAYEKTPTADVLPITSRISNGIQVHPYPGEATEGLHYEVVLDQRGFTVGLHFETGTTRAENRALMNWFLDRKNEIDAEVGQPLKKLVRASVWHWIGYELEKDRNDVDPADEALARKAAGLFDRLIRATHPLLPQALSDCAFPLEPATDNVANTAGDDATNTELAS